MKSGREYCENTMTSANIIYRHLSQDSLQWYKYHGDNRDVSMVALLKHDIVLTTYATLVYEFQRGASMLHRTHWYRFVLDEGELYFSFQLKVF
jgi:hypothetical protein